MLKFQFVITLSFFDKKKNLNIIPLSLHQLNTYQIKKYFPAFKDGSNSKKSIHAYDRYNN